MSCWWASTAVWPNLGFVLVRNWHLNSFDILCLAVSNKNISLHKTLFAVWSICQLRPHFSTRRNSVIHNTWGAIQMEFPLHWGTHSIYFYRILITILSPVYIGTGAGTYKTNQTSCNTRWSTLHCSYRWSNAKAPGHQCYSALTAAFIIFIIYCGVIRTGGIIRKLNVLDIRNIHQIITGMLAAGWSQGENVQFRLPQILEPAEPHLK